jgi:hypothetical protein
VDAFTGVVQGISQGQATITAQEEFGTASGSAQVAVQ